MKLKTKLFIFKMLIMIIFNIIFLVGISLIMKDLVPPYSFFIGVIFCMSAWIWIKLAGIWIKKEEKKNKIGTS